ncbi:MAG: serine/threonine protein kinase [Alphaproteobacteria bacterium]|nr:serine/threonine protein kinase [Alphaproteobacteria bacterium]
MTSDAAPPLHDGRYRLLQILGSGGMAVVYRAWDVHLGVPRAIKVLSPQLTRSKSLRKRFLSEARTMARLEHRHIVSVHDVGADVDRVYMVMELMTGGNLLEILKERGPLSVGQALSITRATLEGLRVAHSKDIIHRDIKPANILVSDESVPKLVDFGIARVKNDNFDLTNTGSILGTFGYMAPEQRANSKQVDARADLYSVAATLYALISGVEPVDLYATEVHAKSFAAFPEPVAEFIKCGTCYNVKDRFQSADEMLDALEPLEEAFPPERIEPLEGAAGAFDMVEGVDLDDMVSDIMPEALHDSRRTPNLAGTAPNGEPGTITASPPNNLQRWVDFVSGMLIVVLVAGCGYFAWRAFGG